MSRDNKDFGFPELTQNNAFPRSEAKVWDRLATLILFCALEQNVMLAFALGQQQNILNWSSTHTQYACLCPKGRRGSGCCRLARMDNIKCCCRCFFIRLELRFRLIDEKEKNYSSAGLITKALPELEIDPIDLGLKMKWPCQNLISVGSPGSIAVQMMDSY